MANYYKPDKRIIISPDRLYLTTELQAGVLKSVDRLFARYLEILGNTKIDSEEWLNKEDYTLQLICRGLGYPDMKFSEIINQALVKGGLEVAKFQADCEKELKITESG